MTIMLHNTHSIHLKDITKNKSSYIDPQGFVFSYKNEIYRCITSSSKPLFQELLKGNTFENLEQNFNLVHTSISDLNIIENPDALIVHHEKIWPISYPAEWCPSMLYHAAKLTLDLSIELIDHHLMLQDAHPWNILYKGTTPIFIDFTSIAKIDSKILWPAHEQFVESFIRPLILSKNGMGFNTRAMMYDYINGISLENFSKMLSAFYHLSHPTITFSLWLNRYIQRHSNLKQKIRTLAEHSMHSITPAIRKNFMQNLLKKISSPPNIKQYDPWCDYYDEIDERFDKKYKIATIKNILTKISPNTVLDIGCNTGVFSIEAAKTGAKVISLDSSEECIEKLYKTASDNKLCITPLIADITSPSPAFGHMCNQFPSLLERAQSDCVLFLGIMHHVYISGRQPFERIAETLDKVANKYLIFEFISIEDDNITHLPQRRNVNYTIDDVVKSLAKYFNKIEILPSDRKSRNLLRCTKE